MKRKINYKLMFIITLIIIGGMATVPLIMFKHNEKVLFDAAKRYFELNTNELPVGENVKTITLNGLYKKAFIKKDLFIPFTSKVCSLNDSWVKVKKENNEYRYYTYLKCGIFSSKVDHIGPDIKLKGDSYITVGKNELFTDPGIESVIDKVDGKISIDTVTVKGDVDTSKIGSYTLTYVATDKLGNRGIANREIDVVEKIGNTVKEKLKDKTNFEGNPSDNYIRLSNMLFRIYGIDTDGNIIIVSDEDISYVGYDKLDQWFDYYYEHLNKETKDMIVEKRYCNEIVSTDNLKTTTCNSFTSNRKIYIPSIDLINLAQKGNANFMKPYTMSWVANRIDDNKSYITREILFENEFNKNYLDYDVKYNLGVRPLLTIKKDKLIVGGDGTKDNPYTFGDVRKAKSGSYLNERQTGEYLSIKGEVYRIIDVEKDGTIKVISDFTINSDPCTASSDSNVIVYNPKKTSSVAYYINNKMLSYIDTTHFVNHKIQVPIYEEDISYKEETETKEYTVKLSAPNMYEMFSTIKRGEMKPYWFLNTSKKERTAGVIYSVIPMTTSVLKNHKSYVRVVAYVDAKTKIMNGNGTIDSPYLID